MPLERVPKVLVLSRNYPSNVLPLLGLWVQRLVGISAAFAEIKVIAPVPYCPPLSALPENFTRFRRIPRTRRDGGVEVFHPRMLIPPGRLLHGVETLPYHLSVAHLAGRLRRAFPFDLIHGHFIFPDGCVAARLGERLGVPVVLTEHSIWGDWMESGGRIRREALLAVKQCALATCVSAAVRDSMVRFAGDLPKLKVVPNVVDSAVFCLPDAGRGIREEQILFVGIVRHVKGVDVLLRSMRLLADRGRTLRLALVGESFYEGYRRDLEAVEQLVRDLGLGHMVEFLGPREPKEVARLMQESNVVVLPSRRESFGLVLAEALACGTPVVATRCGGPEDIVDDNVGVLVPPEDPEALAHGLEEVLRRRKEYDPMRLRSHSLARFGPEVVGRMLRGLYREAMGVAVDLEA